MKNVIDGRIRQMGTSRKAVSRAAGLNETYARDLLDGRVSSPKVSHLAKLAAQLGLSLADLLPATMRQRSPTADRLLSAMQTNRLSPEDLATILGIAKTEVDGYLSGAEPIPYDVLVSVGMRFSISLDWLIAGRDPSPPTHQGRLMQSEMALSPASVGRGAGRGTAR